MKPLSLQKLACKCSLVALLAIITACSPSDSNAAAGGQSPQVADPKAGSSQVITRDANSALDLQTTVLLDIYKQEAYQDQYPVQVPYQEQEEYYEQIPYTEREAYTDYEEYYESEYRCDTRYEQECTYERQCRQVPDRQCRQERVCRPGPREPEQCQNVEECGTNARGERICKTRRVCRGGGQGPDDCRYEQRCDNGGWREECSQERRCRNVPRQHCGYEQVRKTRPVTKYRDVTKYRQEKRTRTVTKERTEYRCCVTKYRDVLDRQDAYAVTVQFPSNAVLQAGEVESLKVILTGGSKGEPVQAKVEQVNTVYVYKVVHASVQANTVVIKLEIGARYTQAEIGEATVTGQRLRILEDNTAVVTFTDAGNKARVRSQYDVVVTDKATGQVMTTGQALVVGGGAAGEQRITLAHKLGFTRDYAFRLTVTRSGPMVESTVSFVKTGVRNR